MAIILSKDNFHRFRGRLGDKFEFDPLSEWTEIHNIIRDDPSYTQWALYQIKTAAPRPTATTADLEQQIDDLDAKLRDQRADFDARYPGGQAAWAKVQDTERDLRDLREKLKKSTAKRPPPVSNAPTATTNAPPTLTANPNEVKK